MSNHKYWRITYLPAFQGPGECEWVFKGSEDDLANYLNEKHSCGCEYCSKESNWFNTANSAEYIIEEVNENEI